MARNRVQFQKGLSERQFRELYGTEEQCRASLFGWRWPNGFTCPRCGGVRDSEIKTRRLMQCQTCRRQCQCEGQAADDECGRLPSEPNPRPFVLTLVVEPTHRLMRGHRLAPRRA